MKNDNLISIVIPLFQAEKLLIELNFRIKKSFQSLKEHSFELILVDDGSTDETWPIVSKLVQEETYVKALKLSRNFGQHNAITAGLERCMGEWIVVMDCDLQDRPEEISNLMDKSKEGFDIVLARRVARKDSWFKRKTSSLFYRSFWAFSGLNFEKGVGNFGVYHKKVIQAVLKYRENFRPFPIIVKVVGFKRTAINVVHGKRLSGKSNYNNFGLIKGALNAIIYYSNRPIWLFLLVGMGVVSFILFLLLSMYFLTFNVETKTLVLILIILMSIVSLNASLMGVYVSRIFIESKNRPLFIIEEELV
ncbi:glycosyltransferase [Salegentibacter sp. BLCTC]|uniref:glycosyltransferase family 2 protein n=1 Tax=Salegentibacter sp. BLCTC TaxID=2697368 RepID=UPI00187BC12C|nr:glycosyltransferase family 2 protein [Salegentibacter sp. BLCTC]MBE7639238.1 glycosyltransferase [Salegentibacter sp. BLCTC]